MLVLGVYVMVQVSCQNSFGKAVFRGGPVGTPPPLCTNGSQKYLIAVFTMLNHMYQPQPHDE